MVEFKDFNFKLMVVNELMYNQGVLHPKFNVFNFIKNYKARKIDVDTEGNDIIPEAKEFFEGIEIPREYLKNIEELNQNGYDDIYFQLCPLWDGEDDKFNIESAEDADILPSLKRVTLFYDEKGIILKEFKKRGIEADWI